MSASAASLRYPQQVSQLYRTLVSTLLGGSNSAATSSSSSSLVIAPLKPSTPLEQRYVGNAQKILSSANALLNQTTGGGGSAEEENGGDEATRVEREAIRAIFVSMPDSVISCGGAITAKSTDPSVELLDSSVISIGSAVIMYESLLKVELEQKASQVVAPEALLLAKKKNNAATVMQNESSSSPSDADAANTVDSVSHRRREAIRQQCLVVWQGDMSLLSADAVVNPANNALLGCFLPSHRCLDNILHAQAGPRLRVACKEMLEALDITDEPNGQCRVTDAFCLPSRYVFHTVGPNLASGSYRKPPRSPTAVDAAELRSCYTKCLSTALSMELKSIAFCCISTGIFSYPNFGAAEIAVDEVVTLLEKELERRLSLHDGSSDEAALIASLPIVVFNVFKDEDLAIYNELLATE